MTQGSPVMHEQPWKTQPPPLIGSETVIFIAISGDLMSVKTLQKVKALGQDGFAPRPHHQS